jgi:hypothetical protein
LKRGNLKKKKDDTAFVTARGPHFWLNTFLNSCVSGQIPPQFLEVNSFQRSKGNIGNLRCRVFVIYDASRPRFVFWNMNMYHKVCPLTFEVSVRVHAPHFIFISWKIKAGPPFRWQLQGGCFTNVIMVSKCNGSTKSHKTMNNTYYNRGPQPEKTWHRGARLDFVLLKFPVLFTKHQGVQFSGTARGITQILFEKMHEVKMNLISHVFNDSAAGTYFTPLFGTAIYLKNQRIKLGPICTWVESSSVSRITQNSDSWEQNWTLPCCPAFVQIKDSFRISLSAKYSQVLQTKYNLPFKLKWSMLLRSVGRMCCGPVLFCGIVVCLDHRHLFGIFTWFGPKTKKNLCLSVHANQTLNSHLHTFGMWLTQHFWTLYISIILFFNELAFVTINESYLFQISIGVICSHVRRSRFISNVGISHLQIWQWFVCVLVPFECCHSFNFMFGMIIHHGIGLIHKKGEPFHWKSEKPSWFSN